LKKAWLVTPVIATVICCGAIWFFLATTPGVRATLGAMTSRLGVPIEWDSVRSTRFGRLETQNLRAVFKEVEATTPSSRHAIWFQINPPTLHFDSKFSDVLFRLTRPQLNGRSILFSEGMILSQTNFDGTSYLTFVDWISPEIELAGYIVLDKKGEPTRILAGGTADPALLGALFLKKDLKIGDGSRVAFQIIYESGFFEVSVNGKKWLRSRWKMRQ